MSEHSNKYAYLRGKSADELNRLLKLAVNPNGEDENDAYVDALLEALAEREYTPEQRAAETDRAWRAFQSAYSTEDGRGLSLFPEETSQKSQPEQVVPITPSRRKRPRLRRTLLVAAVVACLLALLIPTALGHEGFLSMVGQWSNEEFHFIPSSSEAAANAKPITPEEEKTYQSIEEALEDYQVTIPLMPQYIPDGFEISELDIDNDLAEDSSIFFGAWYTNGDRTLIIFFEWSSKPTNRVFEKDDNPVKQYENGGITHYLFQNLGYHVATWYTSGFECSIGGDISEAELTDIIDSIYEG